MAKERKWRVAVMGLGHWYSAYGLARSLPEYPKAELVAVAWHDRAQREEFAATFGIKAYGDYDALLKQEEVDIVHISPPVAEIPECTIKAARAGKHIILGKPMAMTLEQADEMVKAVDEAGVTCVAFQGLFRLGMADLKRRLDEGLIGDIAVMHITARWSIAEDWLRSGQPGWFADPKQVPGGAFIDEGIYSMEQLRWLAGSEVVQVEAKIANLVHKDIAVEDWGMATFTFGNGVLATLEASWTINSPRKSGPSPKQNAVRRLEIVGTRGELIEEQLWAPGRAILAKQASHWVFERPAAEPFAPPRPGALDYLITCIEEQKQPVATIHEARKSFAVALAAYESARLGRAVKL
jgi:predicted dehydrogenase